jgi:SAM-dependent methyltransferase
MSHPEPARGRKPRFAPGVIGYGSDTAAAYPAGRALSQHAEDVWRAAIASFIDLSQHSVVLDLGSGTGRFSSLIARSFDASVVGAEPSTDMLAAATRAAHPSGVAYLAAVAERLPFRSHVFDVAWLSHVLHHVRDRRACARELRRVLRSGARVLVRGTFGDRIDGYPTLFRFFPGARDVCAQLPTLAEIVDVFADEGFAQEALCRVQQRTCGSLGEFALRTRLRADTALMLLDDEDFRRGQGELEGAAAREQTPSPVVETMDLLVFRPRG